MIDWKEDCEENEHNSRLSFLSVARWGHEDDASSFPEPSSLLQRFLSSFSSLWARTFSKLFSLCRGSVNFTPCLIPALNPSTDITWNEMVWSEVCWCWCNELQEKNSVYKIHTENFDNTAAHLFVCSVLFCPTDILGLCQCKYVALIISCICSRTVTDAKFCSGGSFRIQSLRNK